MPNDLSLASVDGKAPETVLEDERLRVSGIRGGRKALFVAFTGIGHRLGALQREEFVKISQHEGANSVLFVQDKTQSWYNNDPDFLEKLQPLVADWARGCEQIVTLGNSMGGFGAIVFADALNASAAIAFSPQFSASPRLVPKDRRWEKFRSKITEFRYESATPYIVDSCRYYLFQGDGSADWYQIGGFPIRPNVRQFVVPGGPHNLAALLRAHGALAPIVEASVAGDLAALRALMKRNGAVLRTAANDIYDKPQRPRADEDEPVPADDGTDLDDVPPPAVTPREAAFRKNYLRRFNRRREARKSERVERIKAEREARQEEAQLRMQAEQTANAKQREDERAARREADRVARVAERRKAAIAKGEAIKAERSAKLAERRSARESWPAKLRRHLQRIVTRIRAVAGRG